MNALRAVIAECVRTIRSLVGVLPGNGEVFARRNGERGGGEKYLFARVGGNKNRTQGNNSGREGREGIRDRFRDLYRAPHADREYD